MLPDKEGKKSVYKSMINFELNARVNGILYYYNR